MMCRALSTEPLVENENRASTSVETFPGTIAKISFPNSTRSRSRAASTFSSVVLPCSFPYATAMSISLAYSSFLEAARIREGLVVASCGLYLPIATSLLVCYPYATHFEGRSMFEMGNRETCKSGGGRLTSKITCISLAVNRCQS
jgi:hypothetical protein